jgi:membrane-associated phospholipid phosphatase
VGAPARQWLAGLGGTFLALAGLTYLLAVGTSPGQLVDEAMKGFWLPLRDDVSGLGHDLFRLLGWPLLMAGAVLVLATCLARRDLVLGVTAGALLLGGAAVVWLAQRGLRRPMLGGETFPHSNTLPSGHASVAAAVALVLLLLARPSQQRLALASALVVAVVGVAVPAAAAAHRPSDVAASFLLVGAWAALVLLVAGRGAPAWRVAGWPTIAALAGIVVALVALAVLVGAAFRAPDRVPQTTNIVWLAGLALVAAVAVVVVAALAPSLLASPAGRPRIPSGSPPDA